MKLRWHVPVVAILASVISLMTAGCASQPCRRQPNFVSGTPAAGAQKVNPSPLQIVVSLTNGSRVIGQTTLTSLSLRSAALGRVDIPLAKIRAVKFSNDHELATVSLQNGDKVQGSLETVALTLRTLFGQVIVPLEKTTEIEVRHRGLQLVEWDLLPVPIDTLWGGDRGGPPVLEGEDLVLRGWQARTKERYSGSRVVECDLWLEELQANDGCVWINFAPAESDRERLMRHAAVTVSLGYGQRDGGGGHLSIDRPNLPSTRLATNPFSISARTPYHLRIELLRDKMRVTLNDQTYEAENVTLPYAEFRVYVRGWQPINRWHVRNFTVH